MNQESFKLISLLPGLYYQKERLEEEIRNIEILLAGENGFAPQPTAVKISSLAPTALKKKKAPKAQKKSSSRSNQISKQQKNAWASYTPEQRAERIRKAKEGKRKAKLRRKKEAKAA